MLAGEGRDGNSNGGQERMRGPATVVNQHKLLLNPARSPPFRNNVSSTLPAAWSTLSALTLLDVAGGTTSNLLSGPLPPSWSALARLMQLTLTDNALTGSLPAAWSVLTAMTRMELGSNIITGAMPATWGALTSLQYLDLSDNFLASVREGAEGLKRMTRGSTRPCLHE